MKTATLDPALEAWITDVTGARSVACRQVPGGASREAWFVDVEAPAGSRELFLRYDRRPPKPGSPFAPLQTEAEIVGALNRAGALVPEIVAVHPEMQAVLQERVDGETWFYLIKDADEQERVAQDFIKRLAEIHRIPPTELDLPSLGPVLSAREHALAEIAAMKQRLANRKTPSPVLDFCVDWLARNVPDYDGPVVLVQGDTGPGNFMYRNGQVTAIVDWELAHIGDPMDDIAWLSLRAAQEPFTDFAARLREYEALSGHAVDEARIWYYRLFAETRLATAHGGEFDARVGIAAASPDAGNTLIYGLFHRRLLIEALARAIGLPAEQLDLPETSPDSPYSPVFDAALASMAQAAGLAENKLAVRYVKSAARLVKYAAEIDRSAATVDRGELAELAELLDEDVTDINLGRTELAARVAAGEIDESTYVRQLWRAVQRDDYLMRTASGALRERTWPPLS